MKRIVGVLLMAVMLICMLFGCSKSPNESKYNLSEELRECMIGDTILMGEYRQTRREKDGVDPIQWTVIAKENNKVLLISTYVLDYQKYNNNNTMGVSWENSSIRQWLNEIFYKNAFNSLEKNIVLTSAVAYDYQYYDEDQNRIFLNTGETLDKIFLISQEEEMRTYKMYDRKTESAYPTEYASGLGATGDYWLRDAQGGIPGSPFSYALIQIERHGGTSQERCEENYGVRPAMWVSIE